MSYWGSKPADSDYAFDAVGVYVHLIKERMLEDMVTVVEKSYPEQGIVASLQCLRLLAAEFPKCVSVSFRKKDFEHCKSTFFIWYDLVKGKIPAKHREEILLEANKEFALFEKQVLGQNVTG